MIINKIYTTILVSVAKMILNKYAEIQKRDDSLTLNNLLCPLRDDVIPEEHISNAKILMQNLSRLEELTRRIYPNFKVYWNIVNIHPNISQAYRYSNDKNGAENSAHKTGEARDIPDSAVFGLPKGETWAFVIKEYQLLEVLQKEGFTLYMENKSYTKTWTHLQIRPVKSGNLIFKP